MASSRRQVFLQLHADAVEVGRDPRRILCELRCRAFPVVRRFVRKDLLQALCCAKESVQRSAALLDFGIMVEALCTLLDTPANSASRVGLALACLGLLLHERTPCHLEFTKASSPEQTGGENTGDSVAAALPGSQRGSCASEQEPALWEIIVTLALKCREQAVSFGCARLIHVIRSLSSSAGDFEFVRALDRACREPCDDPEARVLFLHNVRVVAAAGLSGNTRDGVTTGREPLFSDEQDALEWREGIGCGWPQDREGLDSRSSAGYVVRLALNVLAAEPASATRPGSRRVNTAIKLAAAGLLSSVVRLVASALNSDDKHTGNLLHWPCQSVIDAFLDGMARRRQAAAASSSWSGWAALSDVTCEHIPSGGLTLNVLFDVWHRVLECCRQLARKQPSSPLSAEPQSSGENCYSALCAEVVTEALRWIDSPRNAALWKSFFRCETETTAGVAAKGAGLVASHNACPSLSLSKGCQCVFSTIFLAQELGLVEHQHPASQSSGLRGQLSCTCPSHVQARLATLITGVFDSCLPEHDKQGSGGGGGGDGGGGGGGGGRGVEARRTTQPIDSNSSGRQMAAAVLNALLAEDDAGLFVFLESALSLFVRCSSTDLELSSTTHASHALLTQRQRAAVAQARSSFHPHRLFAELLNLLDFDASVLLDFLISSETCFLAYFLKYLKFAAHNHHRTTQQCNSHVAPLPPSRKQRRVLAVLTALSTTISGLVEKDLFPYNPSALLRRLHAYCDLLEREDVIEPRRLTATAKGDHHHHQQQKEEKQEPRTHTRATSDF